MRVCDGRVEREVGESWFRAPTAAQRRLRVDEVVEEDLLPLLAWARLSPTTVYAIGSILTVSGSRPPAAILAFWSA